MLPLPKIEISMTVCVKVSDVERCRRYQHSILAWVIKKKTDSTRTFKEAVLKVYTRNLNSVTEGADARSPSPTTQTSEKTTHIHNLARLRTWDLSFHKSVSNQLWYDGRYKRYCIYPVNVSEKSEYLANILVREEYAKWRSFTKKKPMNLISGNTDTRNAMLRITRRAESKSNRYFHLPIHYAFKHDIQLIATVHK